MVLDRDHRDTRRGCFAQQARVDVGEAEPAHLPLLDQLLHRAQRLGHGRHAVGTVVVVEVDRGHSEPLERRVDRPANVLARAARPLNILILAELRREHDAFAASRERMRR